MVNKLKNDSNALFIIKNANINRLKITKESKRRTTNLTNQNLFPGVKIRSIERLHI